MAGFGAGGLHAIKLRQSEAARELTPALLTALQVIQAVLDVKPFRPFFVIQPECDRFVLSQQAMLPKTKWPKGQEASSFFETQSLQAARRSWRI